MSIDNVFGARAWCVPEKMMYDVGAIDFYRKSVDVIFERTTHESGRSASVVLKTYSMKDMVLLKYAGISDDEDKRLHEGDIIEWSYGQGPSDQVFTAKVVYVDFETRGDLDLGQRHVGFMIEFNDSKDYEELRYSNLPTEDIGFKIIGNVYENPELWKV